MQGSRGLHGTGQPDRLKEIPAGAEHQEQAGRDQRTSTPWLLAQLDTEGASRVGRLFAVLVVTG